ncbi:hypothetical protein SAMN05216332_101472 [Nitrosospira briensis]|nr:hypothetical protein SAMN05216332_101472 [Nitrosospira briensis]
MGLQADKTWVASRARLAPRRVRVIVLGDFYTIEEHDVILPLDMNLEFIPFAHRFYREVVWVVRWGKAIDRASLAQR